MTDNTEPKQDIDAMLLKEFTNRVLSKDPNAGFDLAQFFWGHLPSNEVNLHLAVAEALIIQSANLGSDYAQEYFDNTWPQMKEALKKRLIRRGFEDKWGE